MPATPLDSALHAGLYGDPDLAPLFSDDAEIAAMLEVEAALAEAQGALGLIPKAAADHLARALTKLKIDPAALTEATGRNGVPVPALVAAARTALASPDHAAWLHYGATTQDIIDTALILRLRQALDILQARLATLTRALGALAEAHAKTPMLARTWGQEAVPSSFGAAVAAWGFPLLRHAQRLKELRSRLLVVSLAGAAGTLSAMGPKGPKVRAALAKSLGLADPEENWHSSRDRIGELAAWCAGLGGSLGKFGDDLTQMAGRSEIRLAGAGGSSTMPQKENPVVSSALVALAHLASALAGALTGAQIHRNARDGAAWMTEWLTLPQLILATGRALDLAAQAAGTLAPDQTALRRPLDEGPRLWAAEAITFALAQSRPRPEAEQASKALVAEALKAGAALPELAARAYPEADLKSRLAPEALLGEAPAHARRFAKAAAKA